MRPSLRLIAAMAVVALTGTACQKGHAAAQNRGGTLTITAQEPDCADPLVPCSQNRWGGGLPDDDSADRPARTQRHSRSLRPKPAPG